MLQSTAIVAPSLNFSVRRNRMSLAIETFADNVRQFCQWAESGPHDVQTMRQLLLALMQGIPYLLVSDDQSEKPAYPSRGHAEWQMDHADWKQYQEWLTR